MADLVAIELYLVKQDAKRKRKRDHKNKLLKCVCVGLSLVTVLTVDLAMGSEVVIVVCDEQGGTCDGRRVGGEGGGWGVGTSVKD